MALVIEFTAPQQRAEVEQVSELRTYTVDISAHTNDYLEFTAHGVKPDADSLRRIADELEKIASIIRSDVITQIN